MKRRRLSALHAFLALAAIVLPPACAAVRAGADSPGTLTGTVRVVGNEPFSRTVLTVREGPGPTAPSRDYLLVGPLEPVIRSRHQGRRVTIEGEACESPVPDIRRCFKPSKVVAADGG